MKKQMMKKKKTSKRVAKPVGEPTYIVAKDVISKADGNGAYVIVNLQNTRNVYSLDGFSAKIWAQLDGRSSIQGILERLAKKGVKTADARVTEKSKKLLADLLKAKLIQPVKKSATSPRSATKRS